MDKLYLMFRALVLMGFMVLSVHVVTAAMDNWEKTNRQSIPIYIGFPIIVIAVSVTYWLLK